MGGDWLPWKQNLHVWYIKLNWNTTVFSQSDCRIFSGLTKCKSWLVIFTSKQDVTIFYYIDMSVLPKNGQLVFSIGNYIRDTSEIFSISSPVKISLTSLLCFSFVFRLVSFFYFQNTHIYVIKRKSHVGLNIWILSSSAKKYFTSERSEQVKSFFHSKIKFICSRHRVIFSLYQWY